MVTSCFVIPRIISTECVIDSYIHQFVNSSLTYVYVAMCSPLNCLISRFLLLMTSVCVHLYVQMYAYTI